MQYYIPQFIEMESKIIGPLTLKQFLIILAPIGIVTILFFVLKSKFIVFIFGAIFIGIGLMLAFLKYQGQDLTALTLHGFMYFFNPREYIWFKEGGQKITIKEVETIIKQKEQTIPKTTIEESKLKKLSWSIQTKK